MSKPEGRYSRWWLPKPDVLVSQLLSVQDSIEVPTAICLFLGSGMTVALSGRLRLATGSETFNLTAPKRKYLYLSFYLR
jgi:hypothetical protein